MLAEVEDTIESTDEKVGLSQKEESDLTERWIFGIPTSTDCIWVSKFGNAGLKSEIYYLKKNKAKQKTI
jgi:alanyl-tRNA synthetase